MVEGESTAAESIKRGFFFALGALLLKALAEALAGDDDA